MGMGALGAGNPLGSAELADGAFASTSRFALPTQRTNLMNGFTGTGALGTGGDGADTGNAGALGAEGMGALVKTCVGALGD